MYKNFQTTQSTKKCLKDAQKAFYFFYTSFKRLQELLVKLLVIRAVWVKIESSTFPRNITHRDPPLVTGRGAMSVRFGRSPPTNVTFTL